MKKVIMVSSVVLSLCANAQVCHTFEDGTAGAWVMNEPGRWRADDISPLSGVFSLHHAYDNSTAATDVAMTAVAGLCTECSATTWEFLVRHGAEPSSSNRWAFILLGDAGPAAVAAGVEWNGFAAGVNMTGYDDTLRLWHITGKTVKAVITTGLNWQTDVGTDRPLRIRITRQPGGLWTVGCTSADTALISGTGSWSGFDPVTHLSMFTGISFTYTSSRDRLLWIDDFCLTATVVKDTAAPEIISAISPQPGIITVTLSEDPDVSFASPGNVVLDPPATVVSAERSSPARITVHTSGNLENRKPATVTFRHLCDQWGNCADDRMIVFTPRWAETGDVVFSEIMADPSPPVGLPETEYSELFNRSTDSLYTGGWLFIAGNDTSALPQLWLRAGERLILCPAGAAPKLSLYGDVAGLSPFPVINDGGEIMALHRGDGILLHAVHFSPLFYNDPLRSAGGWSAELADVNNPFNEPLAWKASADPSGGTPCRQNSHLLNIPDVRCPSVIAAWAETPLKIRIMFDETTVAGSLPWLLDGKETSAAVMADISGRTYAVTLADPLSPFTSALLEMPSSLSDFAGNAPCTQSVRIGLPSDPAPGSVLFNELMPDPPQGIPDYIEFYNNSTVVIDISSLRISGSASSTPVPVTSLHRLIFPGSYLAVTTDREALAKAYPCGDANAILQVSSLPSMPDDGGSLLLYDERLLLIDRVDYSSDMHLLFLSGTEGIALEKVSPALPSSVRTGWHSASELCGWGTPGAVNSVTVEDEAENGRISLSSTRVSPDGDGFEDVVSVDVYPGGEDNVVTVTVFNERGFAVRHLADRCMAGTGGRFIWDGMSDGGGRLPSGLYMILTETWNASGGTSRHKDVCAVVYR